MTADVCICATADCLIADMSSFLTGSGAAIRLTQSNSNESALGNNELKTECTLRALSDTLKDTHWILEEQEQTVIGISQLGGDPDQNVAAVLGLTDAVNPNRF